MRIRCPVHVQMPFLTEAERALATAIAGLGHANPFLPERIALERAVLGDAFVAADPVWTVRPDRAVQNQNVVRLAERAATLARHLRDRLATGPSPGEADRLLYEDLVLYVLYSRYENDLFDLVQSGDTNRRVGFYERFEEEFRRYL